MSTNYWNAEKGKEVSNRKQFELLSEIEWILNTRGESYGNPVEGFERTANIWTETFSNKLKEGGRFTPVDVVMAMIGLKLSRMPESIELKDNYVDIAGYAVIAWDLIMDNIEKEKGKSDT